MLAIQEDRRIIIILSDQLLFCRLHPDFLLGYKRRLGEAYICIYGAIHTCTHTHHLLHPALQTRSYVIRRWTDIRMEGPPVTGWHLHLCRWSHVSVGVPQSFLSNTCMRVQTIKPNLPVIRNSIKDDLSLHPGVLCLLIRKEEKDRVWESQIKPQNDCESIVLQLTLSTVDQLKIK